jgi:hypothetical protein
MLYLLANAANVEGWRLDLVQYIFKSFSFLTAHQLLLRILRINHNIWKHISIASQGQRNIQFLYRLCFVASENFLAVEAAPVLFFKTQVNHNLVLVVY